MCAELSEREREVKNVFKLHQLLRERERETEWTIYCLTERYTCKVTVCGQQVINL